MAASISAIIIAKNEEEMIANCIETVRWCDEIIVVNNDSADGTVAIAHRLGARVMTLSGTFAQVRNEGLKRAKTDWIWYLDADERVTPRLAEEIRNVIEAPAGSAYRVKRTNILYGQHLQHGGWGDDWVVRLFERKALKGWQGEVHESAVHEGKTASLRQTLIHFTHRSVIQGLAKTIEWTPIEARLLVEAHTSPVRLRTLVRKALMELWRRMILQRGFQDGMAGWVEGLTQAVNRLLVYLQVWERQQRPSIEDQYRHHEEAIARLWKNVR